MSDIRIQGVTDFPLCRISFLQLSTYPNAFSRLLILVALASVTNDFKWPRRHLQIFYIWAHYHSSWDLLEDSSNPWKHKLILRERLSLDVSSNLSQKLQLCLQLNEMGLQVSTESQVDCATQLTFISMKLYLYLFHDKHQRQIWKWLDALRGSSPAHCNNGT